MMKKLVFLLCLTFSIANLAQEKIKVTYKSQMQVTFDNDDTEIISSGNIDRDQMKKAIQKAMEEVHYFELTCQGDESSFKKIEKINNDLPQEDGGMRISFSASGGLSYKNTQTKVYLDDASNFGKDFIITDSLQDFDWQITREKSKILNYTVQKATAVKDSATTLEAWYTTLIPIKSGPDNYWGLPGLILKLVNQHQGKEIREFYYEATVIDILKDSEPIEKPTKGEKVTQEEFDRIMDEQMEKFREMYNGGVDTTE